MGDINSNRHPNVRKGKKLFAISKENKITVVYFAFAVVAFYNHFTPRKKIKPLRVTGLLILKEYKKKKKIVKNEQEKKKKELRRYILT